MLGGERLSFDQEAQALYDVKPPRFEPAHFDSLLARLDSLLPGRGPLADRYQRFRDRLMIPGDVGGHGLQDRHRRLPGPHPGPSPATAGRALRPRVCKGHALERLQLVQGQLPQRHPGEPRFPHPA